MHPDQYQLFDLGPIDFHNLKQRKERIMACSKAPNTLRAYGSGWKIFCAWCEEAFRQSLPATPETVCDFICQSLEDGLRLETVGVRIKAISHFHREANLVTPTKHQSIPELLRNARRELKELPGGKNPITPDQLRRICKLECKRPAQVRNLAMLLLAFASGWRRSEVVALNRRDVEFSERGVGLWQRSSKTDQQAMGRYVGVHPGKHSETCPVLALRAWMALRGDWQGPLFTQIDQGRIVTRKALDRRGDTLYSAIKKYMGKIGEDPTFYAGHSTRSGMVTAASEAGATVAAIQRCTGHKDPKMVARYMRIPEAFASNPLRNVL